LNKLIVVILALALAAAAYFVLRDSSNDPAVAQAPAAALDNAARGEDKAPTMRTLAGDALKARDQAVEEAHTKAAEGSLAEAMAALAPHAAEGDEEAQQLMGELNVLRLEKQREERIDYLVKQLSSVPEENTAQRYAIVRELAQLKPRDSELQALRELYGELLIDEVEAGLLNQ